MQINSNTVLSMEKGVFDVVNGVLVGKPQDEALIIRSIKIFLLE